MMPDDEEVQVPYTIKIEGVVGVRRGDFEDRYELEDKLQSTVDVKFDGVVLYHHDGAEVTYLDWPWEE